MPNVPPPLQPFFIIGSVVVPAGMLIALVATCLWSVQAKGLVSNLNHLQRKLVEFIGKQVLKQLPSGLALSNAFGRIYTAARQSRVGWHADAWVHCKETATTFKLSCKDILWEDKPIPLHIATGHCWELSRINSIRGKVGGQISSALLLAQLREFGGEEAVHEYFSYLGKLGSAQLMARLREFGGEEAVHEYFSYLGKAGGPAGAASLQRNLIDKGGEEGRHQYFVELSKAGTEVRVPKKQKQMQAELSACLENGGLMELCPCCNLEMPVKWFCPASMKRGPNCWFCRSPWWFSFEDIKSSVPPVEQDLQITGSMLPNSVTQQLKATHIGSESPEAGKKTASKSASRPPRTVRASSKKAAKASSAACVDLEESEAESAAEEEAQPEAESPFPVMLRSRKLQKADGTTLQSQTDDTNRGTGFILQNRQTAKPAAVEEGAGEEEEQEAEDKEASVASGGTAADTSADTAEAATEVVTGGESMAASPGVGDEDDAAPAAAALADDESDDEADREHADWDANPAEMIIGHTYHNKYIVKRKGLDFTEYGLVDARAAKRQRLNTDSNDPNVAVSLQMVEEYDSFCKDFRKAVHENQDQGNLDLDNIGQGSPLEMCYYLDKLQEENYLLSKPPKRKGEVDVTIKVPMLGVSMVVQRLMNAERTLRLQAEALAAEKAEEVGRLKGELTALQGDHSHTEVGSEAANWKSRCAELEAAAAQHKAVEQEK